MRREPIGLSGQNFYRATLSMLGVRPRCRTERVPAPTHPRRRFDSAAGGRSGSSGCAADGLCCAHVLKWRKLTTAATATAALTPLLAIGTRSFRDCYRTTDEKSRAFAFWKSAWCASGQVWRLHHPVLRLPIQLPQASAESVLVRNPPE